MVDRYVEEAGVFTKSMIRAEDLPLRARPASRNGIAFVDVGQDYLRKTSYVHLIDSRSRSAATARANTPIKVVSYQSLAPDDSAKEPYQSPFDSPTI